MNSAVLNQAFSQARLKINRANRHINELNRLFTAYAQADSCRVVLNNDTQTGKQLVKVVADPIPADMVLAIGDSVHCMSSSLDYVMSGMMRAKTGNATRITFPTNETRQAMRKSFMSPGLGKKAPPNRRIMEAFPLLALEFLTVIKPYKGGHFGLWEIRKADNIDKHNLIIPSITVTELHGVCLVDEVYNNRWTDISVTISAGGVINLAGTNNVGAELKITNYGQPAVQISFSDVSEVFAGDPVIPTLIQASQLVSESLNRIEAVARRYL